MWWAGGRKRKFVENCLCYNDKHHEASTEMAQRESEESAKNLATDFVFRVGSEIKKDERRLNEFYRKQYRRSSGDSLPDANFLITTVLFGL